MRLVYKLLLAKSNPVQLIGFVLANIVGVFILLFGIRAYSDVSATFQDPEGAIANNYLVISRGPVVTGQDNRFTAEELREISQCEGVESIGGFRTANFDLNIDLSALGVNFSSAFFLESIPSQFVDLKLNAWSATVYDDDSYHIDDPTLFVPVILPSAYLKVYNFGLAPGKGLSQLNEAQIKMLVFRMRCHGNGMVHYYKARVVGFTNRINTVLVPEDFLDAANRKYGTVEADAEYRPSRIIIKPSGKNDQAVIDFIRDKGFQYDGTGADSIKIVSLVKGIAEAVVLLGLVICLLAFFLLVVSIHLLIEKNKEKNATLIALGYTKGQICRPYAVTTVILNFVSLLTAVLLLPFAYGFLEKILLSYNPSFQGVGMGRIILVALGLFVVFSLMHALMIRRNVHE